LLRIELVARVKEIHRFDHYHHTWSDQACCPLRIDQSIALTIVAKNNRRDRLEPNRILADLRPMTTARLLIVWGVSPNRVAKNWKIC